MRVITLDAGGDSNFTYLILPPDTRLAWCVDPADGAGPILRVCEEEKREIGEVFLTHTHGDHIASLGRLVERFPARIWVHGAEADRVPGSTPITEEGPLPGLDGVAALFTPGHTPGGICYRIGDNLFTGDTLFIDWVGRADLPGSDPMALFQSLARLRTLPGHLGIYPGHDYGAVPTRTLEDEKKHNKFFSCEDFQTFQGILPELTA